MLKPALARGELHAIGATTLDEYRKYIEKDAALERRFQTVLVGEPTVEDTIAILRGLKEKVRDPPRRAHHRRRARGSGGAFEPLHLPTASCPDKAIDLMDEAASRLRIEIDSMPEEIDLAERKLTQMQIEEQALMKEDDDASRERLENLRKDIAAARDELDRRKAEWHNEKGRHRERAGHQVRARGGAARGRARHPRRRPVPARPSCATLASPELKKQLAQAEGRAERPPGRTAPSCARRSPTRRSPRS